jgi:excinuclease ABC subunit B
MFNGDQARKDVLVEHGFRLPSAKDNRPLNFDEFLSKVGQVVFMTATPGPYELEVAGKPVLQVIRPTGIIDPPVEVRNLAHQVDDLVEEIRVRAEKHERVLVTTLTKKTAEDLAEYLSSLGLRVEYLHSDIDAIERVNILNRLRKSEFDCLVGINLLREGLDLPEVSLVAILDADKEGFLRSERALIQVAGRAARHINGKVILYAEVVTQSMQKLIDVSDARRTIQVEYNKINNITPRGITKEIREGLSSYNIDDVERRVVKESGVDYDIHQGIEEVEKEMLEAAAALEYERAAVLRDELLELKKAVQDAGKSDNGKKPGVKRSVKNAKGKEHLTEYKAAGSKPV